jgi:protein TonB
VHFVDLLRDESRPDRLQARRARPAQPAVSEATPALPQTVQVSGGEPELPDLNIEQPGLAALDLDQGPWLAPPGEALASAAQSQLPVSSATPPATTATPAPDPTPSMTAGLASPGGPAGIQTDGHAGSDEVIPLLRIDPVYPRKAARAGKEGWVRIEFTITERGTVAEAVVVEAKPRRIFNRSALAAINKWQFKPRLADGKPVSRRASQIIEFNLATR